MEYGALGASGELIEPYAGLAFMEFGGTPGCPASSGDRLPFADGRGTDGWPPQCGHIYGAESANRVHGAGRGLWVRADQRTYSGAGDVNLAEGIAIWQRDHGLAVDGVFGAGTKQSMTAAVAAAAAAAAASGVPPAVYLAGLQNGTGAVWRTLWLEGVANTYPAGARPAGAGGGGGGGGGGVDFEPVPNPTPGPTPNQAGGGSALPIVLGVLGAGLVLWSLKKKRR